MGDVFDLDAIEAETEPFVFTHGGEQYEITASPDLRVITAAEEGRLEDSLRLMLGDEQWARIVASEATFTVAKFRALTEAYYAHLGTSLGESRASRRSSKSTARPSKRTSNASMAVR